MEVWLIIAISVLLAALLKTILETRSKPSDHLHLPPGPAAVPFLSTFLWLRKSPTELRRLLRSFKPKLGPIMTLPISPSGPFIFIFSRSLAHKTLIGNGAVFADRPKALATGRVFSSNQHTINSAGYGDTWRILKRNLTSHILHSNRIKRFSSTRSWVLQTLPACLRKQSQNDAFSSVKVADHFRHAMFCLLVFMCFGERLDEDQIRKIEAVHHQLLLGFSRFRILNLHPWITRLIFYRRWKQLYDLKKSQNDVVIPLIGARQLNQNDGVVYVDSLVDLELPDDCWKRGSEITQKWKKKTHRGRTEFLPELHFVQFSLVNYNEIKEYLKH